MGLGRIGRAKEGFGDLISGLEDFIIRGVGEGVRVRTEALLGAGPGDGGGCKVALVADLRRPGRFPVIGTAFCSNMPTKDVVGGIELVSRTCSSLSLELTLLTDPGDLPGENLVKLEWFLSAAADKCCCPVWFGVTDADLDAASVAAIKDGECDLSGPGGLGSCRNPFPPRSSWLSLC